MFDKLMARFKKPAAAPAPGADDELHLAVAALLVEAACADEAYDAREKVIIDRTLAARFSLDAAAAAALRVRAETAQAGAVDIQRFTRVAKAMSGEEKIGLLESLWEIILSDDARDPFEDALMRRICGLIYVDDQESGSARTRVEARLKGK